jgi:Ca2+-binding RTX toxin-like protein
MQLHSTAVRAAVTHLTSGNDTLIVGPTYTSFNIDAGAGNDLIVVSYGNDTVQGGAGNDSIYSDGGNDSLMGGDGNDVITHGMYGSATLSGGAGSDWLAGYSGMDKLDGGTGNDTLVGCGRDVLTGGTGADTFSFIYTGPPIDATVKDFSVGQGDKLDLGQLGYWDQNGYHPLTAANLEVVGRDLVAHTAYNGDAIIHGVGDQVTLIGIANAVNAGVIVLEDKG